MLIPLLILLCLMPVADGQSSSSAESILQVDPATATVDPALTSEMISGFPLFKDKKKGGGLAQGKVLTVDDLLENPSKYASQMVDVHGEVGSLQRALGKAKLFATLRGRFDRYNMIILPDGKGRFDYNPPKDVLARVRLVLEKVLDLKVHKLKQNKLKP